MKRKPDPLTSAARRAARAFLAYGPVNDGTSKGREFEEALTDLHHLLAKYRTGISTPTIRAVDSIMCMAEENSCACTGEEGSGVGYRGHDKDCHVHLHRRHFKTVAAFLRGSGFPIDAAW